jgi:hypothetical protein
MRHETFLYESTAGVGPVRLWLIGYIEYAGPFGRFMKTAFTVMGGNDGTVSRYGEAPYNERT